MSRGPVAMLPECRERDARVRRQGDDALGDILETLSWLRVLSSGVLAGLGGYGCPSERAQPRLQEHGLAV